MGIFGPNIQKMEKKRDVEGLLNALQHNKSSVRERSAFALDRVGWKAGNDTEKVHYLMAKKAWDDLTEMGGPAVNPLIEALEYAMKEYERMLEVTKTTILKVEDVSREDLDVLLEVLGRIGKPAIDPLIQAVKEKKVTERTLFSFEVVKVLGNMGEPALEPMIQLLKDEDSTFQEIAADALGRIGDVRTIEPLVQALKDETKNVYARSHAAYALGNMNDERVVEPLVQALKDQNLSIRTASVTALKNAGWNPANATERVYYLFAEMFIGSTLAGGIAQKDLDEIIACGRHSVEPLIQSLHVEDKVTTLASRSKLIGTISLETSVGDVALSALVKIGKPAVEPLIQALKDNNSTVRRRVASALGEIGDARAAESLVQALEDEDKEARTFAEKALSGIR